MILKILTSLNRALKKLLGIICAVAMGILVLDVLWGVITRYLTGGQASFTEELARMVLICLTFFGGAYAFAEKAHMGLDFLSSRFTPTAAKLCAIVSLLLALAFSIAILVVGGIWFVGTSIKSANSLVCLPSIYMYHIYMCVPLSGIFATSFIVEEIAKLVFEKNVEGEIK